MKIKLNKMLNLALAISFSWLIAFSPVISHATEGLTQKGLRFGATAGETISVGDILYIAQSDGKAYKCDADAEASSVPAGAAGNNASSGGFVEVTTECILQGQTAGTPGKRVYTSGTAGGITVGDVDGMNLTFSQCIGMIIPDLAADTSSTNYLIRIAYKPSPGAYETNS